MKRKMILYIRVFLSLFLAFTLKARAQVYADGRPGASLRMPCTDQGIVLRYGNGPDSCDVYGAREAVVNRVNDT
ncbi:MAG: hypothetical protein Q8918_19110, partial [Bacteroidota bacterium]|nr:hypothetical protein [Bacteroidota bacterium]